MRDEKTYGFNREDAGALLNEIAQVDSEFPEIRPRGKGRKCAKEITFIYDPATPSPVTPTDWFSGRNPAECGLVHVDYPLGEPCTDGSLVFAIRDDDTGRYNAVATKNAIMGDPVTRDVLITDLTAESGCTIGYTKQSAKIITCDEDPVPDSIMLSTETVQVMTDLTYVGNAERKHYVEVYVCGFSAETTVDIPGAVCCTGTTEWTWNYAAQEWTQGTSTCSEGCVPVEPPLPHNYDHPGSNGTTATTDCEPAP